MLNTEYMREGEYRTFSYRITEYDSVTQAIVPVDLTDSTVLFNLYTATQQDDGTFLEEGFATGIPCSLVDADDGWIQCEFATSYLENKVRFKIEFDVQKDGYTRTYPGYADQWIRVI